MDFSSYKYQVVSYLTKLAAFPTQADPSGTDKEALVRFKQCADYIAHELKAIGAKEVEVTKEHYVYATLPSTVPHKTPVIALMAHYDTALENPGNGTKVRIHSQYQKGAIRLGKKIVITSDELREKKGHDIITGSGDNQLGADDKAGIAAILDMARYLLAHPEIEHGKIRLVFNHNEEVGRGTQHLDYKKLGADFAYCVDDGDVGNLFEENFNAEAVTIQIDGVTEHPGYAKGKMINALYVAHELISALRKQFKGPEESEKRQPYLGLNSLEGNWTSAKVHYILRGFEKSDIAKMQKAIKKEVQFLIKKYPRATITATWDDVYRYENAGKILKKHPKVNELAKKAYKAVGVVPQLKKVRGGFDGVRMSFDGLPTSDVFSAAYNMHGLNEWTTRQDLELTVRMLVHLAHLWGKKNR